MRLKNRVKKALPFDEDETDEDDSTKVVLQDSSNDEEDYTLEEPASIAHEQDPKIGDYLLIQLSSNNSKVFYVGLVIETNENEDCSTVSFFKNQSMLT